MQVLEKDVSQKDVSQKDKDGDDNKGKGMQILRKGSSAFDRRRYSCTCDKKGHK